MDSLRIRDLPFPFPFPSSKRWIYDVFLSFRGEDTRKSFVSHLYKALDQKGIYTFKDDETLQRGSEITPGILSAIEESRFSVIVFSENYASSECCLDELVKSLECRDNLRLIVLPIFYEMDPSNLTDPTGSYAKALAKHEEAFKDDTERVKRWKSALTRAANLSGWDSQNSKDETQLIEEIIQVVSQVLPRALLSTDQNLVTVDVHIREMIPLLHLQLHDVRIVGIWGMGGIGKTTVAKAVYDRIYSRFEGCCFLENVKDFKNHSRASLRNELLCQILIERNLLTRPMGSGSNEIKDKLSRKKVLIVLDDVDHLDQLEALAGKHDWFGPGSRVIITTRDKHLLTTHGVDDIYDVRTLNDDNALKLFSRYAFKQDHPLEEFLYLSGHAIDYAKGHPLALKVLGSFLFSRTKPQWEDKLIALKSTPHMEIQNVLRISFDGLQENEKKIFLDIACFYRGEDKSYVIKILESCGFSPVIGMEVLVEKSLISISNNKVWMHDLLQEMGWEIVRNESIKNPGKRSRLWTYEDAYNVLMQRMGTENVEGLILDVSKSKELRFHGKAFASMKNLRLLAVCKSHLSAVLEYHSKRNLEYHFKRHWHPGSNAYTRTNESKHFSHCKIHLSGDLEFLSHELRCLYWHGYPLKYLPLNFHPINLLELDMPYSQIERLWDGKKCLNLLEFIDLSHSKRLVETPNFEGIPNLKRLFLEGCTRLVKVHPSIGDLKMLAVLSLKGCKRLKNIPRVIRLESLETLILSGCSKLKSFPEVAPNMSRLWKLCLDGTAIKTLPLSIQHLTSLLFLNLKDCKNLVCLPDAIVCLYALRFLILAGCINLEKLPRNLVYLKDMEDLDIGGISLKVVASSSFSGDNLTEIPSYERYGEQSERPNFWQPCLWSPSSSRKPFEFKALSLPDFSKFEKLRSLHLDNCNLSSIPRNIFFLTSLTDLDLSNNNFFYIPSSINRLSVLEYLRVNYCAQLESLPALPASVANVYAHGCTSLAEIFGRSSSAVPGASLIGQQWQFRSFFLTNCFRLAGYQHLNNTVLPFLNSQLQSILMTQLQGCSASYAHIKIFVPGSDVPSWFSHQTTGPSLTIHLPSFRSSSTKLMGIAVCTVFATNNHQDRGTPNSLDISVQFNEGVREAVCVLQIDNSVESEHLGLCYAAFPLDWRDNSGCIKVSLEWNIEHMQVRRFGFRLLYYADVESKDKINHSEYSKVLWGLKDPSGTGVPVATMREACNYFKEMDVEL